MNESDEERRRRLWWLVVAGRHADVKIGMKAYPDWANSRSADCKQAPLHIAARKGDHVMCELLITQGGAVVDALDNFSVTPLGIAACNGHLLACRVLIAHGANVNYTRSACAGGILMSAAFNGHADICSLLVKHGADLLRRHVYDGKNIPVRRTLTPYSHTALDIASLRKHVRAYNALFKPTRLALHKPKTMFYQFLVGCTKDETCPLYKLLLPQDVLFVIGNHLFYANGVSDKNEHAVVNSPTW
jgi:hypothetical protein